MLHGLDLLVPCAPVPHTVWWPHEPRFDLATMAVTRLHSSNEIRAVFAARNAAHGRVLTVHGRAAHGREESRAAVVGGRDVGNAVLRNRAKRRLRAALLGSVVPEGLDLVIRAKPAAVDAPFPELCRELASLVARVARRADASATLGETR